MFTGKLIFFCIRLYITRLTLLLVMYGVLEF